MSARRYPAHEARIGHVEIDAQGRRWIKRRMLGDVYLDVLREIDADLRFAAIRASVSGTRPALPDTAAERLGYDLDAS